MAGLFEKGLLAGLGLLEISREKLGEVVDELVKQGEVSAEEGSALIERLAARGEAGRKNLEAKAEALAGKAVHGMKLATADDLRRLEERVARVEALLERSAGDAPK
jgi:polyhydroxyalkanoate synthesis regulator phasin